MEDVDQIQVSNALEYKVFSICYARYLTQIDIYCYWKTFNAAIEYFTLVHVLSALRLQNIDFYLSFFYSELIRSCH